MPCSADVAACSRFLGRLFAARPAIAAEVAAKIDEPVTAAEMRGWLAAEALTEDNLKPALRRLKQRAYARVAARDLAGRAALAEVTDCMSSIAEIAIETAAALLRDALVARYGVPRNGRGEEQQLIVIGMGKLGGRELNVSSDIDLIFVYPDDGDTDGTPPRSEGGPGTAGGVAAAGGMSPPGFGAGGVASASTVAPSARAEGTAPRYGGAKSISNFEFFTRLGKQLIAAIGEITEDGQVFRVDMRLRPNGDSGPLVCSLDMLENYFITQGREWERYAWIKARPLTGERLDELEQVRRPFVFRKYLDFGTINAMRDLHAQIRREVARKDMATNIKLGPGGIREIEFIAQVFQLIRGGRDSQLQIKPTLRVLSLLAERGQLDLDAVVELTAAYEFLRKLEHRLQYLDDAQTQNLPESAEDQQIVARAMGFANFEALATELDDHRQNVSRHFEAVFADPNENTHALDNVWHCKEADSRVAELAARGYHDAATVIARLDAIRSGSRYQQMAEATRSKFDALVPRVIEAAAATASPDAALSRILDLLEAVSRRAAYLALLLQYPQALKQVASIVGGSSWAAEYLRSHPVLLDELLDPRILEVAPDWTAFRAQLAAQLDAVEPDTERQMDLMREAHHAQVFRLLAQDIAGLLTVERLADHLSELADIMLELAIRYAWKKLLKKHCDEPRFAIVSYGKLGGKELGYASDLDLIFLFDDPDQDAAATYAKLATRLNTWLSTQTSAGHLFETDLRLRPNGDAGLMVVSLEAFRKYQLESAWVWEHQALTRARFSAGDPAIGEGFERIRCEILCQERDRAKLREEVLAMRQKMYDAHAGKSPSFDLKHDPGGLIDVEFVVQYLVLAHAREHRELTGNKGNIALLRMAAEAGLIPADLADLVRDAYREYRRLQHQLRLNNLPARVEAGPVAERIDAVRALWNLVFSGD